MTEVKSLKRPTRIGFAGRILFLTDDTSLIRRQLEAMGDEATELEAELARRLGAEAICR